MPDSPSPEAAPAVVHQCQGSETDPDKRLMCDGCGDFWEESFFCKRCSGWELDRNERDHIHKDICSNCCWCHLRGTFAVPATPSDEPDDIPF